VRKAKGSQPPNGPDDASGNTIGKKEAISEANMIRQTLSALRIVPMPPNILDEPQAKVALPLLFSLQGE
jgi:hypothetical protein